MRSRASIAAATIMASLLAVSGTAFASDSSGPENLTAAGDLVYFTANDGTHGQELWVTDGTALGTRLVSDVREGREDSFPWPLIADGDELFFGTHDGALWHTDGSAEGTIELMPSPREDPGDIDHTPFGDRIVFRGFDQAAGVELFVSDGTPAGTGLLADLSPEPGGSHPGQFTVVGDQLFFTAMIQHEMDQLWVTDGTAEGTRLVDGIAPEGVFPWHLTKVGDSLFFVTEPNMLWVTDGTAEGSQLIARLREGPSGPTVWGLTEVGEELFFVLDSKTREELWKSDGTEAGTAPLKRFKKATRHGSMDALTAVDGTVFFVRNDGKAGLELWATDGTKDGTGMVKDIRPGQKGSKPKHLTDVEGRLFFTADDGAHGREVWMSDGSEEGTVLAVDVRPGKRGSRSNCCIPPESELAAVGDLLYFAADDGTAGAEVWVTDGTAAGTRMVADINQGGS